MHDVLDVLVLEVLERAQHGIGRGLAQTAEAGGLDGIAEFDQQIEIVHGGAVPSQMRVSSVCIWAVPARQGMHLPQDSVMQNSMKKRATLTMQEVSSMTIMPPDPMIEPAAISAS